MRAVSFKMNETTCVVLRTQLFLDVLPLTSGAFLDCVRRSCQVKIHSLSVFAANDVVYG